MRLSVIIPTLNEERCIERLLNHLIKGLDDVDSEIIIADAGSTDQTRSLAEKYPVRVLNCRKMSRAFQMNEGAKQAMGDILYFVHADSIPPLSFSDDIESALSEGADLGCYRFKFRSKSFLLAINSYFTRFDYEMCRGGDQTLFIRREVFEDLEGYRNDYRIMEEYEFLTRARKKYQFKIIPKNVSVSARKYKNNSYLRVNYANYVVFKMYRKGATQDELCRIYGRLLKHPKAEALCQ